MAVSRAVILDLADYLNLQGLPLKKNLKFSFFCSYFDSDLYVLSEDKFDVLFHYLDWSNLSDFYLDILKRCSYFIFGKSAFYLYTRLFYSN